jgi:hypothetical protein
LWVDDAGMASRGGSAATAEASHCWADDWEGRYSWVGKPTQKN